MLQNELHLCKEVIIDIEDAIYTKEKIWFTAQNFNSLFCMDLKTKETNFVGFFPNEPYLGKRLYASIKLINNKIYCIPFYAKAIAIYDIKEDKFSNIELEESIFPLRNQKVLFMGTEQYKNYLFIFPVFCSVIICLNLENHQLNYISDWTAKIENDVFNISDGYFRKQVVQKESSLFIPFCNANAVLELNGDTLETKIHKLGIEARGYSGICYDGENFWMSSRNLNEITSWNLDTQEVIHFNSQESEEKRKYTYMGIAYYDKKIRVFPSYKETKNNKFCKDKIESMTGRYSFVKEESGIVLFYLEDKGVLIIHDKKNGLEKKIEILVKNKNINIKGILESKEIITESKELNLENALLSFIDNKKAKIQKS